MPGRRGDGTAHPPPRPPHPGDGLFQTPRTGRPEPRPVSVATARRCQLWQHGTLIHEDPWGSYDVVAIFEDYTATTKPDDPELDRQSFALRPETTLTFIPQ